MFNPDEHLKEYRNAAPGEARLRILREAIQAADDAQDAQWSFRLRDRYLHDSTFDSDSLDALVMFPEMLALYDGSEALQADDTYLHTLLWDCKWVISNATEFSNVPLEQIEGCLAEFRSRLERAGRSLRPYHYLRETCAMNTGNLLPESEFGKYRALPEDDLKDCAACEVHHDVRAALLLDRRADAERISAPLFSGELHCAEVPQVTYGVWLEYCAAHGEWELGRKYARRLYPMASHEMELLDTIGQLLRFYASADRQTGTSIFRRELPLYMKCRNHRLRFEFALGAARLFGQMQMDTITLVLPSDFPLYQENHRYQSAALADYFMDEAETLAAQFDERNGNTFVSDKLHAEDAVFDEDAVDTVYGAVPPAPSVLGAVCNVLPDELTLESVTAAIESDERFHVLLSQATEDGLLAFQVGEGAGNENVYQLMLCCQPVPPVEEFRPASPLADDVFEAVRNAEGVVMCLMPFEEKQPDAALHFQLRMMNLICPGAAAYLDYSRRKLLPMGWVAMAAVSEVPPLVDYLYNLNLRGDDDGEHLWIRTEGLRCCGLREVEILDATKENFPRYCDMLCFAVERMLLCGELPEAHTPFTVLRRQDGSEVVCTWVPASEALADYPDGDAGMRLRLAAYENADPDDPERDGSAILYLYDTAADGSPARRRLNALTDADFAQFCYGSYIATSQKVAALAQERFAVFVSLFPRYPENAYVCALVRGEDGSEDEVWVKAETVTEDTVTGILTVDCALGTQGSTATVAGTQLTDYSVCIDQNLIIYPNTAYIGLEIAE